MTKNRYDTLFKQKKKILPSYKRDYWGERKKGRFDKFGNNAINYSWEMNVAWNKYICIS